MQVNERELARFWSHVNKTEGCWEWTAARTGSNNYGRFKLRGKPFTAHRLSYIIAHGPIPDGLKVLHRCDNPACVRPDHLWLGTHQDNMDDKVRKNRHWVNRGESHGMAKLTAAQVVEIRQRRASGEKGRALAVAFNVSEATISTVCSGKRWGFVPL